MKQVVVGEHGRILRWDRQTKPPDPDNLRAFLEAELYRRLYRFDCKHSPQGQQVFGWHADYAQAQQWVGVIQIPGLQLEILPKIDTQFEPANCHSGNADANEGCRNDISNFPFAHPVIMESQQPRC